MVSKTRRTALFERDGYRCAYCRRTVVWRPEAFRKGGKARSDDATLDHKIPKAGGGSSDDANLATCCRECNRLKGNTGPKRFGKKLRCLIVRRPLEIARELAAGESR